MFTMMNVPLLLYLLLAIITMMVAVVAAAAPPRRGGGGGGEAEGSTSSSSFRKQQQSHLLRSGDTTPTVSRSLLQPPIPPIASPSVWTPTVANDWWVFRAEQWAQHFDREEYEKWLQEQKDQGITYDYLDQPKETWLEEQGYNFAQDWLKKREDDIVAAGPIDGGKPSAPSTSPTVSMSPSVIVVEYPPSHTPSLVAVHFDTSPTSASYVAYPQQTPILGYSPTSSTTESPTSAPTDTPTASPMTSSPTTAMPTESPTTDSPTVKPTVTPTTERPTVTPTSVPTGLPTGGPTGSPTDLPTFVPTSLVADNNTVQEGDSEGNAGFDDNDGKFEEHHDDDDDDGDDGQQELEPYHQKDGSVVVAEPDAVHDDEEDDDDDDEESEEHHHENDDKPWGAAIGAALLVNLVTLIGLIVLIPTLLCGRYRHKSSPTTTTDDEATTTNRRRFHWFVNVIIPSFACGALLATTVFLILPESILLIGEATGAAEHVDHHDDDEDEHDHLRALREQNPESQLAWKFGTAFVGGFLLPLILSTVFPHHEHQEADGTVQREESCPVCQESMRLQDDQACCGSVGSSNSKTYEDDAKEVLATKVAVNEEVGDSDDDDQKEAWETATLDASPTKEGGNQITAAVPLATAESPTKDTPTTSPLDTNKKPLAINYKLASSILLGDFFHNFADGVFIGTAFSLCDTSVAVAVTVATVYHELCQELADYFLLTAHCHILPAMSLGLNFVSGLAVLLGVLVILAIDVNQMATGCILAVSGGVYVNVAAAECTPRVEKEIKTWKDRIISILCFAGGAIPIGLVLLNHGHCDG